MGVSASELPHTDPAGLVELSEEEVELELLKRRDMLTAT
jgi:hypothetical protein